MLALTREFAGITTQSLGGNEPQDLDDALSVMPGDYLDFGDCYGGHWTKQLLVLKNNADVLLDVSFGVQKGFQVMFQLAELAPQTEDDTPDQEELPPSAHITELSLSSASTGARPPPRAASIGNASIAATASP